MSYDPPRDDFDFDPSDPIDDVPDLEDFEFFQLLDGLGANEQPLPASQIFLATKAAEYFDRMAHQIVSPVGSKAKCLIQREADAIRWLVQYYKARNSFK